MVTMISPYAKNRSVLAQKLATAPPALRLVIPTSHHGAPLAKFVDFCVETTLGYARCLVTS